MQKSELSLNPRFYPGMTAYGKILLLLQNFKTFMIPNICSSFWILLVLPILEGKKCKHFSLGMKQRLAIAIALIGNPKLLILDEPTNGLDPEGMKEIRELILKLNQERHITVLVSSHILGELSKFATRYGIIHHGKLIEEFTEEDIWRRSIGNGQQDIDLEDYFLSRIGGIKNEKSCEM